MRTLRPLAAIVWLLLLLTMRPAAAAEIAVYDFAAKPVDMILIAPQVRYKKRSVTEMAAPYGIVVQDIAPTVFGMVDGENLFQQIRLAVRKEATGG